MLASGPLTAQEYLPSKEGITHNLVTKEYSPYVGREFPTRALFGETHLHTAVSVDAGTMCKVGQEDAYRFARGQEITTTYGLKARLSRPLDFMVLTDHADRYGLMPALLKGHPTILRQDKGRQWYDALTSGDPDKSFATAMEIVDSLSKESPPIQADEIVRNAWRNGRVPTFLVAAMKDAYSGNLDRIQIIKGWMDASGKTHEWVYDVAWSGDRNPGTNDKLPPVGNTVDVRKATWKNTIGAPELIAVWKDPAFDPKQRAFYYARVIEIPTPRWTAYEAKRYGITMPDNVPMTTQERAYTSPIWYTP